MALQNIGASNSDDAFYRYKMPRMITKIEGRGNGIKTNVVNMVDIAKALARPAAYTTKYFGCELGAQSKFDDKTGVSLVNGAHDTAKLASLLENFIKKYVQCYECNNPETEIIITKTQMIHLKCAACGFVSEVDMRDKLTTFILKNPPEQKKGTKDKKAMRRAEKERLKEGEAADEEQKKIKKEMKKKGAVVLPPKDSVVLKSAPAKKKSNSSDEEQSSPPSSQVDDNVAEEDDDVQWQTDTSMEAARKRIQEQLNAVTAEMVMLPSSGKDEKENKHEEKKEAASANGGQVPNSIHSGYVRLITEIKKRLDKGCTASQLSSFILTLGDNPKDVMSALFEALFESAGKGFAKDVGKKKSYLAVVVKDEASQMHLLQALESFCLNCNPDACKEAALVAKVLYDVDILEEECILQWYKEGIAGKNKAADVWKNVKPFIEWLQNAEEEE